MATCCLLSEGFQVLSKPWDASQGFREQTALLGLGALPEPGEMREKSNPGNLHLHKATTTQQEFQTPAPQEGPHDAAAAQRQTLPHL